MGLLARWHRTGTALAVGLGLLTVVPALAGAPATAQDANAGPIAPSASLPVVHRVNTNDAVVFITIDDGIVRSAAAREYVERERIPITSFLTASVTTGHERYFSRISRWGSVENHTVSHRDLSLASTNVRAQVCPVQRQYRETYGARPTLLRPPYGSGARLPGVQAVAADCDITHIVLWDAVVDGGRLETWYGGSLRRGSIILLHYGPGLLRDLQVAMAAVRAQGLAPADLRDYLR